MKRLLSAEIQGFRAFGGRYTFDFDADVVILSGPNGSGKTSLFDAVLWTLSGQLPRFAGRKAQVISLFSPSGSARVAVTFEDETGKSMTVIRTASSEARSEAFVETSDGRFEGSTADLKILETFWPSALLTKDSVAAFCMAFTRSVYLQQDLVREFIESDSEEERFTVMSELLGAGRLSEFLRDLERDRNAWSRGRSERAREASEAELRVAQIRTRVERLRESADQDLEKLWTDWWRDARLLNAAESEPALSTTEAGRIVNEALGVLQGQRRALDRRSDDAGQLLKDWTPRIQGLPPTAAMSEAQRRRNELSAELEEARNQLVAAQQAAAVERERLVHEHEASEELRSLATLALRHLGESCPVCEQKYPVEKTRQRLERLVAEVPRAEQRVFGHVDNLARRVATLERSLSAVTADLAQAEQVVAEARAWHQELARRLEELDLPPKSTPADLDKLIVELGRRSRDISELYARGEAIALSAATASEIARRAELEEQLASAEKIAEERRRTLAAHETAGDTATNILEATRVAARELVDARVSRIEPLVARIYARMDPHPAFTDVSLGTSYRGGRGRVQPLVADPGAGLMDHDPYTLFSSSQLNALAVSLFLGLNIGTSAPLRVVMLDDPLQSLDDVNLLGLVDTLRRTKALRQLLVSTHDLRFTSLLQRKLRPVGEDGRTRVMLFSDWTESGPIVETDDVTTEPEQFRIAAA
jgi:DNA repair exonuclease SbcCD ATPase subunit